MGEHLLCKQGVVGSIPSASTKNGCNQRRPREGQALPGERSTLRVMRRQEFARPPCLVEMLDIVNRVCV